jgi:hypothetical protein
MDSTTEKITITERAAALASRHDRVVVPTDDRSEAFGRARRAALQLARQHDWNVVLYDRSDERWTDTPHPVGVVGPDGIDPEQRPHLIRQLADFEAAGVTAGAFLATVPALTAMLDVIQEIDVDAILLPDELDEPTVMDRLQVGDGPGAMVARVAELQLDRRPTMYAVDATGRVDIAGD